MHTDGCCRALLFSLAWQQKTRSWQFHDKKWGDKSSLGLPINPCLHRDMVLAHSYCKFLSRSEMLREATLRGMWLSHLSWGLTCNSNLLTGVCSSVLFSADSITLGLTGKRPAVCFILSAPPWVFTPSLAAPQAKSIKSEFLTGICLVATDLCMSSHAKPHAWETCTHRAASAMDAVYAPPACLGFIFLCWTPRDGTFSVQAATQQIRLTAAQTERGSPKHRLYRRYIKLSSSAVHSLSDAAQAAAATSARSGLPEGYTYHTPK